MTRKRVKEMTKFSEIITIATIIDMNDAQDAYIDVYDENRNMLASVYVNSYLYNDKARREFFNKVDINKTFDNFLIVSEYDDEFEYHRTVSIECYY